jgi:hypothetical protein
MSYRVAVRRNRAQQVESPVYRAAGGESREQSSR